jgi:hypothetical protein
MSYTANKTVRVELVGGSDSPLRMHEMGTDGAPICAVGKRWTHAELLIPIASGTGKSCEPCQYTPHGRGAVDCGLCARTTHH